MKGGWERWWWCGYPRRCRGKMAYLTTWLSFVSGKWDVLVLFALVQCRDGVGGDGRAGGDVGRGFSRWTFSCGCD